ncbi:MAG: hypothetical protein FWG54_06080 [Bacteroidetes bacterium]|nr:hypothetical protein [Bacteroidota bacterium]
MSFSKNNQSKISKLEKEYMSKIKGGDENDQDCDAGIHPCYYGCQNCGGGSGWNDAPVAAMSKASSANG